MLQARGRHESALVSRQMMAQRRAYERALKQHDIHLTGGEMSWGKAFEATKYAYELYNQGKSARQIVVELGQKYGKDIADTVMNTLFKE